MNDRVLRGEVEGAQIGSYSAIINLRFLQNVTQIDVGVEKGGVQRNCLLKMMDRQPDLSVWGAQ